MSKLLLQDGDSCSILYLPWHLPREILIKCNLLVKDVVKYSLYIIQICSGITRGRVLNEELYAQRLQKLI